MSPRLRIALWTATAVVVGIAVSTVITAVWGVDISPFAFAFGITQAMWWSDATADRW